jgi:hypothetical protein
MSGNSAIKQHDYNDCARLSSAGEFCHRNGLGNRKGEQSAWARSRSRRADRPGTWFCLPNLVEARPHGAAASLSEIPAARSATASTYPSRRTANPSYHNYPPQLGSLWLAAGAGEAQEVWAGMIWKKARRSGLFARGAVPTPRRAPATCAVWQAAICSPLEGSPYHRVARQSVSAARCSPLSAAGLPSRAGRMSEATSSQKRPTFATCARHRRPLPWPAARSRPYRDLPDRRTAARSFFP